MTNTIYACCLSTYLRISTAAALTISTPYLHSSAQPPVAAPEAGTATTPLCHAGTAQLTSISVERGKLGTRTSVSVQCHVSRVTCHVSRVMMLWPTDRCGTAASQVRQRRKYLSTEYLLGEDSCDIWSGSGAQNSVWDTRYEGLVGNTVDTHEIQISTIDNFIVIIIVISTFVDSWTPVKSFLIFILLTLLHFT